MRIAQVAPLYESVPPKLYGGTERVVSHLTEELVRQGHAVTLFASGDSRTAARLIAPIPQALRLGGSIDDAAGAHVLLLDEVMHRADEFDIVHYHIDYVHFPVSRLLGRPQLTTLHGRLDLPALGPIYRRFFDMPVVSISADQQSPLRHARWVGTVHHGLPAELFRIGPGDGGYLAFLGRISPEKRVDRAIAIAQRTGMELRIAAKVDPVDAEYFDAKIVPLMGDPLIRYVGEIGEREKQDFLGRARALLFPIDWPEPFGLVTIEAMACGTPVIAYNRGAVPEIIAHGKTGFIVDDVDSAVEAAGRIGDIDRGACRAEFERRFVASRMAREYLGVYRQVIAQAEARDSSDVLRSSDAFDRREHPQAVQ
jgi:glycosyltransferase involved in cell wall biosynthesis